MPNHRPPRVLIEVILDSLSFHAKMFHKELNSQIMSKLPHCSRFCIILYFDLQGLLILYNDGDLGIPGS